MKHIRPEMARFDDIAFVRVPSGFYVSKELYKENGKPKVGISQGDAIAIGKEMSSKRMAFRPPTSAEWTEARRYFQKVDESRGIDYMDGDSLERDMLIGNCEYTCSIVDFKGGYPFYPEEKEVPELIRNICFVKYIDSSGRYSPDGPEPENNRKEFEWLRHVPNQPLVVYKIKEWDDRWGFPSKVDPNSLDGRADVCVFPNRLRTVSFKDRLPEEYIFGLDDFSRKTFLEWNRYNTKIGRQPGDASDIHSFRLVAQKK